MKLRTFIKELQCLEKAGHGEKQIILSDLHCDSRVRPKATEPHKDSKDKDAVIVFFDYGDLDE